MEYLARLDSSQHFEQPGNQGFKARKPIAPRMEDHDSKCEVRNSLLKHKIAVDRHEDIVMAGDE